MTQIREATMLECLEMLLDRMDLKKHPEYRESIYLPCQNYEILKRFSEQFTKIPIHADNRKDEYLQKLLNTKIKLPQ